MLVERGEATRAADVLHDIGQELAEEAVNLRRIMSDLRPPVLEERGLIPAVRELCARLRRELRIPVTVVGTPGTEVPREIETLAYRIVQEAVSNAGKHASATEVEVRISSTAGTLAVEASDAGQGFEPEQGREFLKGGKVGLASMRERTELAGGTFAIRSGPGSGTTIS